MQVAQPGKKQTILTVENKIAPSKQVAVILMTPALLVVFFMAIFIIENEGLSTSSDYFLILAECLIKALRQGNTECLPDLGYIILCTILGGPFALFCSYKIWQHSKTAIILTNQKIVKKKPSGKEIQLYWSEIKKVRIISTEHGSQLNFTKTKGRALFNDKNRIFCPPDLSKEKPFLPPDAANLILKKIDRYNITVKGNRDLLEEIIKTPHQSQQEPTGIETQNITPTTHFLIWPSSAKKPTPK
ncbi:MAG: hypothetical protein PVG06_19260 [Desulfobacterales bacterium]|jgi:hypothetical protein